MLLFFTGLLPFLHRPPSLEVTSVRPPLGLNGATSSMPVRPDDPGSLFCSDEAYCPGFVKPPLVNNFEACQKKGAWLHAAGCVVLAASTGSYSSLDSCKCKIHSEGRGLHAYIGPPQPPRWAQCAGRRAGYFSPPWLLPVDASMHVKVLRACVAQRALQSSEEGAPEQKRLEPCPALR